MGTGPCEQPAPSRQGWSVVTGPGVSPDICALKGFNEQRSLTQVSAEYPIPGPHCWASSRIWEPTRHSQVGR